MNKKQLIVLGVGILVICGIILTAPKYIYIPHRGNFNVAENPSLAQTYGAKTSWDTVLQYSIPVILIGGFLIYLLRNPIKFPKIPKAFLTFLKYSIAIIISAGLVTALGVYLFSLKQSSPVQLNLVPVKNSLADLEYKPSVATNTITPPAGFVLENDITPQPPSGFVLENDITPKNSLSDLEVK